MKKTTLMGEQEEEEEKALSLVLDLHASLSHAYFVSAFFIQRRDAHFLLLNSFISKKRIL